jgi:hypothetical protein
MNNPNRHIDKRHLCLTNIESLSVSVEHVSDVMKHLSTKLDEILCDVDDMTTKLMQNSFKLAELKEKVFNKPDLKNIDKDLRTIKHFILFLESYIRQEDLLPFVSRRRVPHNYVSLSIF